MKKKRLLLALAGGLLALPVVEGAFVVRDDGAFPHVNLYQADEALGARLQPSQSMRLRVTTNPVTVVNTNALGFRGADWPEPGADEVLVVGDSQVFGLGVEEDQTFSAVLAEQTGRTVLNAGVPTYGPREMQAIVNEVVAQRPVTEVVVVVNMLNDLFEMERPNKDRHVIWDGWAVRSETAPESVMPFPGRQWLMSRSHAMYALRGLLRGGGETVGVPSEGAWEDLVVAGEEGAERHAEADETYALERARRAEALQENRGKQLGAEDDIDHALRETRPMGPREDKTLRAARGDPGDIVETGYAEASRPIALTADHIRRASAQRRAWEAELREREAVALRDQALEERKGLQAAPLVSEPVKSVLAPWLAELATEVEAAGARLTVVVLPVDVQVHRDEWAKYGLEPEDMTGTHVLLEDIARDARAVGARSLIATTALRRAEPGAFLDADIHMSAKGHDALATALASVLDDRAPVLLPKAGIPSGRTRIPEPEVWDHAPEILVRGSSKANCWTLQVDEWLRVTCRDAPRNHPSDIDIDHPEARVLVTEEAATLVVPRLQPFTATFHWDDRSQVLVVEEEKAWFEAASGQGRALAVSEGDERLCNCHKSVFQEEKCEDAGDSGDFGAQQDCHASCETLYGSWTPECDYQFCDALLQCARGDILAPPTCDRGEWDVLGLCRPLCSEDVACDEGICTEWMGSAVCI